MIQQNKNNVTPRTPRIKKIFVLILFLICWNNANCQIPELDSLRKSIKEFYNR